MDGGGPDRQAELIARQAGTLDAAIEAVRTRKAWSPFSDSPSTKIHGPDKPGAGKAAFEARLGTTFDLNQPGQTGATVGEEVSPFTQQPLNIRYPVSDPDALVAAAMTAMAQWRETDFELRLALCLEMAQRLYQRNFEMAHAVM
ncbi:MAG: aldehyde dehydrogenase, partial [Brevundimonas sp.]